MTTLSVDDAVLLVRKNLDELDENGSGLLSEDGDNTEMNKLIAVNLPEAINAVHLAAPAYLLEGKTPEIINEAIIGISLDDDGVFRFSLDLRGETFLRLSSLRMVDSPIVVTDVLEESSPEGRKQLNPFVRGTFDRPRLVREQAGTVARFRYYSISKAFRDANLEYEGDIAADMLVKEFSYVPRVEYEENAESYGISVRLKQNIIDYLTGLIMVIYGDNRSEGFFNRAQNFEQ